MAYGDGEEPYPTEGEQGEAELGFVGALEGDDITSEEESEGDGAVRHTPGIDGPDAKASPQGKGWHYKLDCRRPSDGRHERPQQAH